MKSKIFMCSIILILNYISIQGQVAPILPQERLTTGFFGFGGYDLFNRAGNNDTGVNNVYGGLGFSILSYADIGVKFVNKKYTMEWEGPYPEEYFKQSTFTPFINLLVFKHDIDDNGFGAYLSGEYTKVRFDDDTYNNVNGEFNDYSVALKGFYKFYAYNDISLIGHVFAGPKLIKRTIIEEINYNPTSNQKDLIGLVFGFNFMPSSSALDGFIFFGDIEFYSEYYAMEIGIGFHLSYNRDSWY